MIVSPRRYLRKMRDREDLVMLGDSSQCVSNLKADLAADSSVDFIENERRN